MYAPKPAICGHGHAAMQKTQPVIVHPTTEEKTTQNKTVKKHSKIKSK